MKLSERIDKYAKSEEMILILGEVIQLEEDRDEYRNLYHMAEAKVLSRDALLEQLSEEQLTQDLAKAEAENKALREFCLMLDETIKGGGKVVTFQDVDIKEIDALLTGESDE